MLYIVLIESPLLSRHRLRHRQVRGGGSPSGSRTRRPRCGAGGWQDSGRRGARQPACRRTRSRDSPSGRRGTRPSGTFVERLVVCHEGQALDERFYLRPHLRENRCVVGVGTAESVHLRAPVVVVVRLGLDERVERIYDLAVTDNDYSH